MWMMSTTRRNAEVYIPLTAPPDGTPTSERWPKGLLALTIVLAALAPLAMLSGRIPGLGEFDYLIFYRLLFYNDVTNSLAMLAALVVALAVRPLRTWMGQVAGWVSVYPIKTCVLAFVALALAARVVYQGFPLAMDEYAPLLQARIFAQGDIAITYPRELLDRMVVPGFQGYFILVNHETGQAASAYWPGLALLMTPFALFHAEWLLNPLLGAAGLWLIGDLAKQATGKDQARGWAMLAALACPQYTVNAISFYAMTALLTLNLLFLWLLLRPGWRSALLAGVVGSIALVLHNPVPHALFALPVGIWLLASPERRNKIPPLVAGYLPLTILLCTGWPLLTGSMGLRPLGIAGPVSGFITSWLKKLHDIFVITGLEQLQIRSYAAWKILIWGAPGLLLISFIAKPRGEIMRLLLAAFLLTYAFYFFIPLDQGHGWGYRYVHATWGLLVIATAVFATHGERQKQLVAIALAAGLLATPAFMYSTHKTITSAIAQQPPRDGSGPSLVFIANQPGLYTPDLVRN
ncbi:MAG: hypothetical protein M3R16_06635, partial [Pseudomonadota bacterium]|nr:hypothetical protein [Pseudomonadota bacterium]